MILPHSLAHRQGSHTCCCSGSPHLSVEQLSCFLSLMHSLDSKLQILKGLVPLGSASSSGLEPLCALTSALCPTERVPCLCSVQYLWCRQHKAMNSLCTSCGSLCALPMKGCLLAPSGSFVLGEAIYPLPNVLQEGEQSLPVWHRRSLCHLHFPMPEPSFSLGVHAAALLQQESPISKTWVWAPLILCTKDPCNTQFACIPSLLSKKFPSGATLMPHFLNPSLLLSFSFLADKAPCPP